MVQHGGIRARHLFLMSTIDPCMARVVRYFHGASLFVQRVICVQGSIRSFFFLEARGSVSRLS